MEEGDAPAFVQAGARDVVEQLDSGGAALIQGGVDILDLVGDVMHPWAALRERLRDRAVRAEEPPGRMSRRSRFTSNLLTDTGRQTLPKVT